MNNKIGDIYFRNGVYFIVTELINGRLSDSIPLSRYILQNYIGSTQEALNIFQEKISKVKTEL
jgi:hypothetical protein